MSPLLAACCLLATGPSKEVFLFPRPAPQGDTKAMRADDATDALDALGSVTLAAAQKGLDDERLQKGAQEFQRLIKETGAGGWSTAEERPRYMPDQPLDTVYQGFWQTRYEFSLSGAVLGLKLGIFSSFREEVWYRTLRGYWCDYGVARVFFGAGFQGRFTIQRLGRTYVARSLKVPPGSPPSILYAQLYGSDEESGQVAAPKGNSLAEVLRSTLSQLNSQFDDRFSGWTPEVEPVLVELKPDVGTAYVKSTLSNRRS